MNKGLIACVSCAIFLGLAIGGGFVANNAAVTKEKKEECHECWYQYNITVASLMFILALLTFACCTIALLSDRWIPAMPTKAEAIDPVIKYLQQVQNAQLGKQ